MDGSTPVSQGSGPLQSARLLRGEISVTQDAFIGGRDEVFLQGLIEAMPDAVLVVSESGKPLYYNQIFKELWRLPSEVLRSRSAEDTLNYAAEQTSDPIAFKARVASVYDHPDRSVREELLMKDARLIDRFGAPLLMEGHRVGWVWTFRDVTEVRRAERTLNENYQKHQFFNRFNEAVRPLADAEALMAMAVRMLGEHLHVSRCAYADVQADSEHFIIQQDYTDGCPSTVGHYRLSLFGPRAEADMKAGRTLVVRNLDKELSGAEGADMFAAIQIQAIICCPLVKEGRLRAMMAVHQTTPRNWSQEEIELVETSVERCWATIERARAEQALRESEEQNRLLLENIKDFAILAMDVDGRITGWNRGAESVFGYSETEVLGANMDCIFTPEDRADAVPQKERQMASEKGFAPDERWHLRKNGERFFSSGMIRAVYDDTGKTRGFVKVARDITRRKQVEDELREARENLEETVAERTAKLRETIAELEAFSYSISHDMRGPLRAMQGFSVILRDEFSHKLGSEGSDYLARIERSAHRLDELIRDVLSYSRIARTEVKLEPVEVAQLVHDIVSQYPGFQPPCARIQVDASLPRVMGQASYLTQVLSNLLSNAVKFVPPERTPEVRVYAEPHGGRVRILIQDNGIGIVPRDRERIFNIFERVHAQQDYEGTGIGLSIVRKAIERMGGRVGLESTPGQGSCFWFELPEVAVE